MLVKVLVIVSLSLNTSFIILRLTEHCNSENLKIFSWITAPLDAMYWFCVYTFSNFSTLYVDFNMTLSCIPFTVYVNNE